MSKSSGSGIVNPSTAGLSLALASDKDAGLVQEDLDDSAIGGPLDPDTDAFLLRKSSDNGRPATAGSMSTAGFYSYAGYGDDDDDGYVEALSLDELIEVRSLEEDTPFSFLHLGVLYFLCGETQHHLVSRSTLSGFGVLLGKLKEQFRFSHSFQGCLQAYADIALYRSIVRSEEAKSAFVDWFLGMLEMHRPRYREFPERYPGIRFIHRDALKTLYELMRVGPTIGIDLQAFIDLLQRSAEEAQLLDLEDEKLDDWCPDLVLRKCLKRYLTGFCKLMESMHVAPSWDSVPVQSAPPAPAPAPVPAPVPAPAFVSESTAAQQMQSQREQPSREWTSS